MYQSFRSKGLTWESWKISRKYADFASKSSVSQTTHLVLLDTLLSFG